VLQQEQPKYFIRADIKSFYKSIPHNKLIQDIKKYYDDPKLNTMLKNIIKNPIDSPYGYKNPDHGIALRGPLSQFLSGIYLKPLDDAFNQADVTYLRYQDDILILCKTKRQLNRCKRRMMNVLQERQLRLSKRKTRIGEIESGFHFLGIQYPPTRTVDNTSIAPVGNGAIVDPKPRSLDIEGGVFIIAKSITRRFTHGSASANTAQSTRVSQMDGRRWCFSPQDQTLSYSMAMLVGKHSKYLGTPRTRTSVYRIMLESRGGNKCRRDASTILRY